MHAPLVCRESSRSFSKTALSHIEPVNKKIRESFTAQFTKKPESSNLFAFTAGQLEKIS